MAFIDFYYAFDAEEGDAKFSGINWIYNVHEAVGPGAPNRHEDVALVQTLLSVAAPHLNGMHNLRIDGLFGRNTRDQILAFQTYVKTVGASVLTDGRVDRAIGALGSISHTRYTIRWLNDAAKKWMPNYFPILGSSDDGHVVMSGTQITGYSPGSLPHLLQQIFHKGVVA